MENKKIAHIFQEIGDILEILGDSRFRIRSYHNAAQVMLNHPEHMRDIYEKDPKLLKDIPGIGDALREKIVEILETGDCQTHLKLVRKIPHGVLDILRLRGIGPKKTKLFYGELGIDSVMKLKDAARRGLLRELPGMGEKSEAAVLEAIESYGRLQARMPMPVALDIAESFVEYLKKNKDVIKCEYAGSLRRRRTTVGDIDILVSGPESIIDYFCEHPDISIIEAKGSTKATVILESGVQVDLRLVAEESFGAALYYFTGSKAHNIATRKIAQKMGLKINEYGVFKGEKSIAGKTEEEVFESIKLPYIIPEMREDTGEIEFMRENPNFKTVSLEDIKGDLHSHSDWSDGKNTIQEMASAAQKMGYQYLAQTDHSALVKIAHGLSSLRLHEQMKEIDKLNKEFKGFHVLKGIEVDILRDGSLDLPDDVLAELDIVVASAHTYFNLSREEQTERLIRAVSNPNVNILGHPTGKLLGHREAYEVDLRAVMRAAKENNVAIELNCNPKRLDLETSDLRYAKELGIKISLDTDSHSDQSLWAIKYGIFLARRGWLEPSDILNTMDLDDLLKFLDA